MSPITHALAGWMVAEAAPTTMRSKTIIVLAGVAPDLDGLGILAELATRGSAHPLTWFSDYHHILGHNLAFSIAVTAAGYFLAREQRWRIALLALLSLHLHLLADLAGSRGPEGYAWPIPYLLPFSSAGAWQWSGQWRLDSWQNLTITVFLLATTLFLAWRRGYSPLAMVSKKADAAFIRTLRRRFPRRHAGTPHGI
jgi:membrane-bound metal-dependent hydrolase YbcI (DUF457 family)